MLEGYEPSELSKEKAKAIVMLLLAPNPIIIQFPPVLEMARVYGRILAHVIDTGDDNLLDKVAEEVAYAVCEKTSPKNVEECAETIKDTVMKIFNAKTKEEIKALLDRELARISPQYAYS